MILLILWILLIMLIFTTRCYAERGIATAKSSVRDVKVSWSHSSKIISSLVSLGCSLSAYSTTSRIFILQRERPEILIQSDPPPVELSVADIQWQIAAEWLEIMQWSQWRAYRKPTSLFPMVPIDDALRPLLSSKWASQMHPWLLTCEVWF